MSHRPIAAKKAARLRRAIKKSGGALPSHINLIDWLKAHGHAQTTDEAKRLILDKRVKSESHVLGIERQSMLVKGKAEMVEVVNPFVPARLRETLTVVSK